MQFLFDHLISTLVAGTVLVLVAAVFVARSEQGRDVSRYYAVHQQQQDLIRWLETDLMNLGVGTPAGQPIIAAHDSTRFRFYGVTDPQTGTTGWVSYTLVPTSAPSSSPHNDDDDFQSNPTPAFPETTYRVERRIDGGRSGTSSDWMTACRFRLLDATGTPTSSLPDTHQIQVFLEWMVPEMATPSKVPRRLSWTTTIRPYNLN